MYETHEWTSESYIMSLCYLWMGLINYSPFLLGIPRYLLKDPWGSPDPNLKSTTPQKVLLNLSPVRDATVYGWENPRASTQAAHITVSLTGWYCQVTMCACLVSEWLRCDWLRLYRVRQCWVTSPCWYLISLWDVSSLVALGAVHRLQLRGNLRPERGKWKICFRVSERSPLLMMQLLHCFLQLSAVLELHIWIHITCQCRHVLVFSLHARCRHWTQHWTLHAKDKCKLLESTEKMHIDYTP